jgi:gamma-glutamylcyclotransferase (GGCT)/AIG2-like uncharacterized protein YtfP
MSNLVFVYGTLMKGHGNHSLLSGSGAIYVSPSITKEPFLMSASFIPYVSDFYPADMSEYEAHIRGELYLVNDVVLESLDALEGHPRFYERKLTDIWYYEEQPDGSIEPKQEKAWLYFCDQRGSTLIPSGNYKDYSVSKSNYMTISAIG